MKTLPIRTEEFRLRQSLLDFVAAATTPVGSFENCVLAVTSKIVSLAEGRVVQGQKSEWVQREAERVLGRSEKYEVWLTLKHGLLIPSAGIDESNSRDGGLILYPVDPWASAQALWTGLRDLWGHDRFGVVLTDSHTTPLRRGVNGIALSTWGFRPVKTLVGAPDLFGRPLQYTSVNVADAIASAAVFAMGESSERQPLCQVSEIELEFTAEDRRADLVIPPEEDLYTCLFS